MTKKGTYYPTLRSGVTSGTDPPDIFRAVSEIMDLLVKAAFACTLNALTDAANNTDKRIFLNMETSILLFGA